MPRTSSSRPTPARAHLYQSPPGGEEHYEQAPQQELPEWAGNPFTLYISYLHAHVPVRMLFSVLRQTGLGMMRRQGAIELTKHEPREQGGYPFQSAKIHFDFLFTRGDDGERNLQTLEHLLHGGDDAHFQVVYQTARKNPKTGKDDPERFWKVKAWREHGLRSVSPADSPSVKISLHGGSVGPKDAKPAPARTPQVVKSDDGWSTVQSGPSSAKSDSVTVANSEQKVGGDFAALAESEPKPMTKTAKKNAKKAAARRRKRESEATPTPEPTEEVAAEVAEAIVQPAEGCTEDELRVLDDATDGVVPQVTNQEIADQAAEFLAESQIREEGAENCGAWELDAATGSILFYDEMTAADAETIVPPHEVLDESDILAAE
jgi:hypothetical protein